MNQESSRTINIYTAGTAKTNLTKLTKNNPQLEGLEFNSLILCSRTLNKQLEYSCGMPYINLSQLKTNLLSNALHQQLSQEFQFTPLSLITDQEGKFTNNPQRKALLLEALINNQISHYIIETTIPKIKNQTEITTQFLQGYTPQLGIKEQLNL